MPNNTNTLNVHVTNSVVQDVLNYFQCTDLATAAMKAAAVYAGLLCNTSCTSICYVDRILDLHSSKMLQIHDRCQYDYPDTPSASVLAPLTSIGSRTSCSRSQLGANGG